MAESVNAVAYLLAHGATPETAAERALAPYEQEWRATGEEEGEFRVLTDPGTGRGVRSVVYPMGEWEEPFAGKSELFGEEPGTVLRHTTFEEHPEVRGGCGNPQSLLLRESPALHCLPVTVRSSSPRRDPLECTN